MALPDYTTQDAATYKANIDATAAEHDAAFVVNTAPPINIGDWDMDATGSIAINHGIADYTKIRTINVMIRQNAGTLVVFHAQQNTAAAGATQITLSREAGGIFDNTNYDSTSYNRGFITITYID